MKNNLTQDHQGERKQWRELASMFLHQNFTAASFELSASQELLDLHSKINDIRGEGVSLIVHLERFQKQLDADISTYQEAIKTSQLSESEYRSFSQETADRMRRIDREMAGVVKAQDASMGQFPDINNRFIKANEQVNILQKTYLHENEDARAWDLFYDKGSYDSNDGYFGRFHREMDGMNVIKDLLLNESLKQAQKLDLANFIRDAVVDLQLTEKKLDNLSASDNISRHQVMDARRHYVAEKEKVLALVIEHHPEFSQANEELTMRQYIRDIKIAEVNIQKISEADVIDELALNENQNVLVCMKHDFKQTFIQTNVKRSNPALHQEYNESKSALDALTHSLSDLVDKDEVASSQRSELIEGAKDKAKERQSQQTHIKSLANTIRKTQEAIKKLSSDLDDRLRLTQRTITKIEDLSFRLPIKDDFGLSADKPEPTVDTLNSRHTSRDKVL